MSFGSAFTFAVGVAVLVLGAELLVRGAAAIAARTGLPAVVIGLTVVAFGTSAPELAVSVHSARVGQPDLAMGNVVGSNIANVLLVLGLSAMAGGTLVVAQRIVRIDVPVMLAVSVAVLLLALDHRIGRVEGALLVAGLTIYVSWTVIASRRERRDIVAEYDQALSPRRLARTPVAVDIGLVLAGLVGLVLGARWLVNSASTIAADLGVSDLVIGLTVVAVGTSLPEIATSVVAALRGERDIAVGNAVGSNIFNLLCVLGFTGLATPAGVAVSSEVLRFDLPIMIAVAVACLPVFFTGYELARWEGSVFVVYYGLYLAYLAFRAGDGMPGQVGVALAVFVVPLTALTLAVVGTQAWRQHQRAGR